MIKVLEDIIFKEFESQQCMDRALKDKEIFSNENELIECKLWDTVDEDKLGILTEVEEYYFLLGRKFSIILIQKYNNFCSLYNSIKEISSDSSLFEEFRGDSGYSSTMRLDEYLYLHKIRNCVNNERLCLDLVHMFFNLGVKYQLKDIINSRIRYIN